MIEAQRQEHGFLLTAWVFLPDPAAPGHALLSAQYPRTISLVLESVKVRSTRQINTRRKESGRLWQGRFLDRALRTVKEYHETVGYIHWNPVRQGLVKTPDEWPWSGYADYSWPDGEVSRRTHLQIDRVRLPADLKARI